MPESENNPMGREFLHLAALGLPDEFVLPDYNLSIANLPPTLAIILGGRLRDRAAAPLPIPLWSDLGTGVRRIICLVLDAAGWEPFAAELAAAYDSPVARLAESGRLVSLTSVFPSFDLAALASLWTGYTPAQHGIVGQEIYLRSAERIVSLRSADVEGPGRRAEGKPLSDVYQAVPTLGRVLASRGIALCALLQGRSLPLALTAGATEIGTFQGAGEMWERLHSMLAARLEERLLLIACGAHRRDMASVQDFLTMLQPAERRGALLVITAPCGQAIADRAAMINLADHPALLQMLYWPPTGNPRAVFLHVRPDTLDAAEHYLNDRLAEHCVVVRSSVALAAGLLGPGLPHPEVSFRLGDLILLARGAAQFICTPGPQPVSQLSGGLSAAEMRVPLLMARLDN